MDTIGPHAAFLITTCTACTCLIVLPFTPDPLPTEDKSEGGSGDEQEALVPGDGASDREEPAAPSDDGPLDRLLKALRPDGVVRTAGSGLIVGLLVLVFGKMWRPLLEVILQYMSVRFKWPLGKVRHPQLVPAGVQSLIVSSCRLPSSSQSRPQCRSHCLPSSCRRLTSGFSRGTRVCLQQTWPRSAARSCFLSPVAVPWPSRQPRRSSSCVCVDC